MIWCYNYVNTKYFHPLDVVSRWSDPQLQVIEKWGKETIVDWRITLSSLNTTLIVFNPFFQQFKSQVLVIKWQFKHQDLQMVEQLSVCFTQLKLWVALVRHNFQRGERLYHNLTSIWRQKTVPALKELKYI